MFEELEWSVWDIPTTEDPPLVGKKKEDLQNQAVLAAAACAVSYSLRVGAE